MTSRIMLRQGCKVSLCYVDTIKDNPDRFHKKLQNSKMKIFQNLRIDIMESSLFTSNLDKIFGTK